MNYCIIFDVFGVLLSKGFNSSAQSLSNILGKRIEEIKPVYERWEIPFDLGSLSEERFWQHLQQDLNTNVNGELLNKVVLDSYYPLKGAIELLQKYSNLTDVYLLSNTRREWFEYLDNKYNITKFVKKAFLSYQSGLLKPDLECYLYVIRELGVQPNRIIFLDDSEENVHAALSLGIKAHQFSDSFTADRYLHDIIKLG